MSKELFLPKPTEEELNMTTKSQYFTRLYEMDLDKKFKITSDELCDWIHHNFQAVYLLNEEISLGSFKNLKK